MSSLWDDRAAARSAFNAVEYGERVLALKEQLAVWDAEDQARAFAGKSGLIADQDLNRLQRMAAVAFDQLYEWISYSRWQRKRQGGRLFVNPLPYLARCWTESRLDCWNDYYCCSAYGGDGEVCCGCQGATVGEYYLR